MKNISKDNLRLTKIGHSLKINRTKNLLSASVMLGFAVLASGCANQTHSVEVGATPDDYRTRHPIMIAERDKTVNIPVSQNTTTLTLQMSEIIEGVAQSYRSSGAGILRVMRPEGAQSSHAAIAYSDKIRRKLVTFGVPEHQIAIVPYNVGQDTGPAPIQLTYSAISAYTETCGKWSDDILSDLDKNENYQNFGCATQSNLAAQIANPADLLAPRGRSPVDAGRRATVIDAYQTGGAALGQ